MSGSGDERLASCTSMLLFTWLASFGALRCMLSAVTEGLQVRLLPGDRLFDCTFLNPDSS
jgi:hypothetical protein